LEKERIDWIDLAKGFGMLLVIFAHVGQFSIISFFIVSFHMPFFFLISGYTFSNKKYPNFTAFVKKRIKTLIIPYLCFSLLGYLFLLYKCNFFSECPYSLVTPIPGAFLAIRASHWTDSNPTLWFVACLFTTEVLFFLILNFFKKNNIIILILFTFSLIGYAYTKYFIRPLPWSIDAACIAILFYGTGFIVKENRILDKVNGIIFFLLLIVGITAALNNSQVDMFASLYGNYFLFVIAAFSNSIAFLWLSKFLNKSYVLQYIGKNSLIYLALHQSIILFFINQALHSNLLKGVNQQLTSMYPALPVFYTLITVVVTIPIIFIINNYLPFLLGKTSATNVSKSDIALTLTKEE